MAIEKKKSKMDKVDDRIAELKKKLSDNPSDEKLKFRLRRLMNYQLYTIQQQTKLLGDYMKFERENNHFREEEI